MTPASITQWLQEPHRNLDPEILHDLQQRYPYFAPLHYMAIAKKQQEAQPVRLAGHPDLFMGNWLLFHQMMQQSVKIAILAPQHASETYEPPKEEQLQAPTIIIPFVPGEEPIEKPSVLEFPLIQPVYSEDYFLHQGIKIENDLPEDSDPGKIQEEELRAAEDPKSLMVVMSFTEWLMHFKSATQKEKEDEAGRKAVKHMWQMEKLAAAHEEEDDEIPENVFEMAVNSITKEDGLASESLAEILSKQGKWDKAIDMYRKLSLRNPQKSAYFAQQIATIQKKSE